MRGYLAIFFATCMARGFAGASPAAIRQIIGQGYDISTQNFWDMRDLVGSNLMSSEAPDNCFMEVPCAHRSGHDEAVFQSIQDWENYFIANCSTSTSGTVKNMQASINASFGLNFSTKYDSERHSFFYRAYNQRVCYGLSKNCLVNSKYLSSAVAQAMTNLPTGTSSAEAMQAWENQFIAVFGTHMVVESQHGAKIQQLSSITSSCRQSMECLKVHSCLELSFLHGCPDSSSCPRNNTCRHSYQDSCVVVGGDSNITAADLCSPNATSLDVQHFLDSGNLSSRTSAIGYQFVPISQVLLWMGFYQESVMLANVVEFRAGMSSISTILEVVQPVLGASVLGENETSLGKNGTGTLASKLRSIVGQGYDIMTQNFWDWNDIYGFDFLTDDSPDSCYREMSCTHGSMTEHAYYKSTQEWERSFQQSFGLGFGGSYQGVGASIGASFGSDVKVGHFSDRESSYASSYNRRACYELKSECLSDKKYMVPAVSRILETLPVKQFDEDSMAQWEEFFIKTIGSHISVASHHGAMIQELSSINNVCDYSSDCLDFQACLGISFLGAAQADFCYSQSQCTTTSACSESYRARCVVVGGSQSSIAESLCRQPSASKSCYDLLPGVRIPEGPNLQLNVQQSTCGACPKVHDVKECQQLCDAHSECQSFSYAAWEEGGCNMCCIKAQVVHAIDNYTESEQFLTYYKTPCQGPTPAPTLSQEHLLEEFLNSGDMQSQESAIGYTFKPIWEVLVNMGLFDQGLTLRKATEYHNCVGPARTWMKTTDSNGNEDFGCQCTLKCQNGGTLDADTCSCKCRGDVYHGWTSIDCSDTYGKCQPGDGTHNMAQAIMCAENNACATGTSKQICRDTDVCCMTSFGATCCPFGNTCNCGAFGCKCEGPANALNFLSYP